jgi:general secretion pathway protein G
MPFKRSLRDFRGFTLVELLVVIGIISILATILLLQLGTARAKSRDAKRIADVNQVRSALEAYFDDNGTYPIFADFATLAPKYLSVVPKDPLTSSCTTAYNGAGCYGYAWATAAPTVKYQIWAELEVANRSAFGTDTDVNAGATGDWNPAGGTGTNGSVETCVDTSLTTVNCVFDLGYK